MKVVYATMLAAALAVTGCHKAQSSAPTQAALQPQEVNWNQNQTPTQNRAPAAPAQFVPASAQVTVNGSNVTAQLSNIRPGTELTLAWFGADGWNVTNEAAVANGNTVTFAVPKFPTSGRYEAELLNGVQLLGTVDVNA